MMIIIMIMTTVVVAMMIVAMVMMVTIMMMMMPIVVIYLTCFLTSWRHFSFSAMAVLARDISTWLILRSRSCCFISLSYCHDSFRWLLTNCVRRGMWRTRSNVISSSMVWEKLTSVAMVTVMVEDVVELDDKNFMEISECGRFIGGLLHRFCVAVRRRISLHCIDVFHTRHFLFAYLFTYHRI